MADQRRYGFHQGKDARAAMQARYDSVFGKINKETAIDKELADKEQNDFVMSVGRRHYVRVLFARVFSWQFFVDVASSILFRVDISP